MSKPESAEGAEVTSAFRPLTLDQLTDLIIGAAIEVHRNTEPGLMESTYEECLCYELTQRGITFRRQVRLPISYKGVKLDCGYIMDLVVEDSIVLELKTGHVLPPGSKSQLLTYVRQSRKKIGLLLFFGPAPEVQRVEL